MKRLARYGLAALAAAAAALGAQAPAAAQWTPSDLGLQDGLELAQYGGVTARDAVRIAQAHYPGSRYVDTFAVFRNGELREHVVVLVTADGRRAFVRVDARSGRVIGECASHRACQG